MRAPVRALVWPGQIWPRVPNVPLPPPAPVPVTPVGGSQTFAVVNLTGSAIAAGRVVTLDSVSGGLVLADCTTLAHADQVLGITTAIVPSGQPGTATQSGELVDAAWTWTPGAGLFLGSAGAMVEFANLPVGALFERQVAGAMTATRIVVDDEPAVVR